MHKTIKYFTKINKQHYSIISSIPALPPLHHQSHAATTLLTKDLVIFATWLMYG
jgi:hypothetical protein